MKYTSMILLFLPLLTLPLVTLARVNGTQTATDISVTSPTTWTTLATKTFDTSPDPQTCVASVSADAKNPKNKKLNNQYRFTVTLDSANPAIDGACERTLEFDDNASIDDDDTKDISTTCTFSNVSASVHTVRFLARKVAKTPVAPNLTVTDNSMTISCTDNPL